MAETNKKVLVSLPVGLLRQVDEVILHENITRSQFIREAMQLYIRERHKLEIRERMMRGYEDMARINAEWAELGLIPDTKTLEVYETLLAECEE